MTKKKRTTVLILLVVIIYAAIVVRFFMLSEGDSSQAILPQRMQTFTPENVAVAEQFTIANDYPDPFLGTLPSRVQLASSNPSGQQFKKKEVVAFPTIIYKGLVADASNGKPIFALSIEGKEYVVAQGKVIQEIKVLAGDLDAITLSHKGSKKMYIKNQ